MVCAVPEDWVWAGGCVCLQDGVGLPAHLLAPATQRTNTKHIIVVTLFFLISQKEEGVGTRGMGTGTFKERWVGKVVINKNL